MTGWTAVQSPTLRMNNQTCRTTASKNPQMPFSLRWFALAALLSLLAACGGTDAPLRSISTSDPGPLTEESPLDPSQVLEGHPVTHSRDVHQSADGDLFVAYWSASAGRFTWNYRDIYEVVTILDGEAFVKTSDGTTHHLKPGVTLTFVSGDVAEWNVPRYIRKVAVVKRQPRPLLRRVADKLARIAGR